MSSLRRLSYTLIFLIIATTLSAQTAGSISGHVTGSNGDLLPGVTVQAKSPSLQGVRTAVTRRLDVTGETEK